MSTINSLKNDATVTLGWFKLSIPTLVMIISLGYYVGTNLNDLQNSIATLRKENTVMNQRIKESEGLAFRTSELEKDVKDIQNTQKDMQEKFIQQLELMRESLNKLSLQVEIMNERLDSIRPLKSQKQGN